MVDMYSNCFLILTCASLCLGQLVIDQFQPTDTPPLSPEVIQPKTEDTGSCGGKFNQSKGRIASPNYPLSNYPSNANCTWTIDVEDGKLIIMQFEYMSIEVGPPDCPFDGVIVVDDAGTNFASFVPGPSPFSGIEPEKAPSVLGKYCGQEKFKPFVSATNSVKVGFYSDEDFQFAGFVLTWRSVDAVTTVLQSCDFEAGFCEGWRNVDTEEDTFDWSITSGETPTMYTGPKSDHTLGNRDGKYAFIETSSPQIENDTALLTSPQMKFGDKDKEFCMEFWYHMFGETMGSLVIGIAQGEKRSIEWMRRGDQGDKWQHAKVPIKKISGAFRVVVAGVCGSSYHGDVAIDDVKIYGKPCADIDWKDRIADTTSNLYNTPCENDSDYPCLNSTICIHEDKMCDGNFDCPQKDDESTISCSGTVAPVTVDVIDGNFTGIEEESTAFTEYPSDLTTFVVESTDVLDTTESIEERTTRPILTTSSSTEETTTIAARKTTVPIEKTTNIIFETTEITYETTKEIVDTTKPVLTTTTTDAPTTENDLTTTDIITTDVSETTPEIFETTSTEKQTDANIESTEATTSSTILQTESTKPYLESTTTADSETTEQSDSDDATTTSIDDFVIQTTSTTFETTEESFDLDTTKASLGAATTIQQTTKTSTITSTEASTEYSTTSRVVTPATSSTLMPPPSTTTPAAFIISGSIRSSVTSTLVSKSAKSSTSADRNIATVSEINRTPERITSTRTPTNILSTTSMYPTTKSVATTRLSSPRTSFTRRLKPTNSILSEENEGGSNVTGNAASGTVKHIQAVAEVATVADKQTGGNSAPVSLVRLWIIYSSIAISLIHLI